MIVCSNLDGWQTFVLVLDTEECPRYGFPPNVWAPSYFIGWCQLTELMSLSGGCQRVSLGPDSLEVGWSCCIVFPSPRRIVMTDSAGGRGPHSIAQGYSLGCPYSLSWLWTSSPQSCLVLNSSQHSNIRLIDTIGYLLPISPLRRPLTISACQPAIMIRHLCGRVVGANVNACVNSALFWPCIVLK